LDRHLVTCDLLTALGSHAAATAVERQQTAVLRDANGGRLRCALHLEAEGHGLGAHPVAVGEAEEGDHRRRRAHGPGESSERRDGGASASDHGAVSGGHLDVHLTRSGWEIALQDRNAQRVSTDFGVLLGKQGEVEAGAGAGREAADGEAALGGRRAVVVE